MTTAFAKQSTLHQLSLLARDLHSIRHDLGRIIFNETEHVIETASLRDAVDMLDGALIVIDGVTS